MTKLTADQLEQYREQGFFILKDSFAADEMAKLTEHIDLINERQENLMINQASDINSISSPKIIMFIAHLAQMDEYIEQFIMQQKFVDITTSLLGPDIKLYWDQSVYKHKEINRDFPWHQDTGYAPTEPQEYLTIWLALEDTTIENGCIWVQPGSHHQGLVEHTRTEFGEKCYFGEDPGIPVPLKAGSMAVFNSLLFHRSTPNLSDTIRKGYIIQYSVSHAYNPNTGVVFDNGPVIAKGGLAVQA